MLSLLLLSAFPSNVLVANSSEIYTRCLVAEAQSLSPAMPETDARNVLRHSCASERTGLLTALTVAHKNDPEMRKRDPLGNFETHDNEIIGQVLEHVRRKATGQR